MTTGLPVGVRKEMVKVLLVIMAAVLGAVPVLAATILIHLGVHPVATVALVGFPTAVVIAVAMDQTTGA